jgi:hypothetical protein
MCDERERLIGYLYDECDASERQLIDTHLETCRTCREEVGGLRRVREDLLAWEVPPRDSVWMPFAPPRPPSWWREVPGWALAAAASITFLAGAAGGAVTYALMPPAPAASALMVDAPDRREPMVPVTYDNVTRRELTAAEQRIVEMLRAEIAARLARTTALDMSVASSPAARRSTNAARAVDARALSDGDHDELVKIMQMMTEDIIEHRRSTDDRLQDLTSQVYSIRTAVTSPPGR